MDGLFTIGDIPFDAMKRREDDTIECREDDTIDGCIMMLDAIWHMPMKPGKWFDKFAP